MRYASATAKHQMNERADSYATARIVFASGQAVDLGKDDFWLENSYIESSESSSFPIGTLIAKSVTLSLVNDDERWEGYAFYGCQIFLYSNFDLDDGTTFTIFLGTFSVITPERYGQAIEISGVDDSYKTDKDYTTSLTFPTTANAVFLDACNTCNISPAVQAFTNDNYVIAEKPSGTFRQIFGELAALAGGNAKFDNYNRLNIVSYSLDVFTEGNLYGGIFDPATPYATGDTADGGRYNPWNTGDVFNSGTFAELNALFDQYKTHYLPSWLDLTVEADDVVITGVQIERNGTIYRNSVNTNYIITLNPSISTGNEQAYVQLVGGEVIGFRFRPFSGEYISYPLAEAMDLAIIVDRRGRVYNTVLTEVVYNFSGSTSFKCDADAPIRNQSKYSSEATKEIVELRNQTVKQIAVAEQNAKTYSDAQLFSYAQTINAEIDGLFDTWFYDVPPTLSNPPASEWTSIDEKDRHIGDLYYDTFSGLSYEFRKTNNVYSWVETTTSGIGQALVIASDAKDTADHKRRVYVSQPTNADAYDVGDLWVNATYGTTYSNDLLRCKTAKTAGASFNISHWEKASKYTDDAALTTFITGTYATDKSTIESQLDGKADTWYQSTDPATSWSTAEKPSHKGDIWYCTATSGTYAGKNWMYSGSAWEEFTADVPQSVYDMIDGKASIFVGSTTPSNPQAGDLWFKGANEPILTYVNGNWVTYNKYTDDSTFTTFQTGQYATDQAALRSLVSTENSATKAFANTLSTLIAQGMGLFFTEEVQQDESVVYYMHDKQTLALSTNIWRISGNAWSVSTDGGTTWNAAIDAQGNILVNTLSAVGISFSWAKGGQLSLGGLNDGNGIAYIYSDTGTLVAALSNNGFTIYDGSGSYKGRFNSSGVSCDTIKSAGPARSNEYFLINNGVAKLYNDQDRGTFYAGESATIKGFHKPVTSYVDVYQKAGLAIGTKDRFVAIGKYSSELSDSDYTPYMVANIRNNYEGFKQDNTLFCDDIYIGKRTGYNSSTGQDDIIQLGPRAMVQSGSDPTDSSGTNAKHIKFSIWGLGPYNAGLTITGGTVTVNSTFNATGSKHRVVDTQNYGTVSLNAFETADCYFSDIGSGTVGADGTVTIVFDPVFAETIEMGMEYQVLITRTSAKMTEWVDKQHGMFIVHGEAGATFDWMVMAKQLGYGGERMEPVQTPPEENEGPIIKEDHDALTSVEEMVQQYEEGVDIL